MVTKMPLLVHFPPNEEFTHIRHPQKMKWYHMHQLIINKKYKVKELVLSHWSKYIVIFKFLHMVSSTCAFKSMSPPNDRDSFKCVRVERAKVYCLNSRHSIHLVTLGRLLNLLMISLWYKITHLNAFLFFSLWKPIFFPNSHYVNMSFKLQEAVT